jgi:hypothetical protein
MTLLKRGSKIDTKGQLARAAFSGFTPRMDLRTRLHLASPLPRPIAARTPLSLLAFTIALAGCEKVENPPPEPPVAENATIIGDEHNYTSVSVLTPPEITTAADTDLTINWDNLNIDMQCHDMDPVNDIEKVALIRFRNLSNEDAAALLTAGELDQNQVDGYLQYETERMGTTAMLSDLSVFGSPVDILEHYAPVEGQTYMLLWGTTETPGVGARTMTFIRPVVGDTRTIINAPIPCDRTAGTGILEFTADLSDVPVAVTADPEGSYVMDWRGVSKDSLQNDFAYNRVTSVLLGFFADKTPADLELEILDIELNATDLWDLEHEGGKQAALSAMKHRETGENFDGFEDYSEGTWLLALRCDDCQNPSPLVLAVLEPPPPAGN